jgi:hypothetical protein
VETGAIPGVSIGRRLAVGGMAEVHLAERDVGEGAGPCVVKRLLPRSGPEVRALFAREATALAALTQAGARHVVPLLDAGPDGAAPEWLVLVYVDGIELGALLDWRRRRGRPLPVGAAMAVAEEMAAALLELAEAATPADGRLGLVHQDLHPGNLIVGTDGRVTVIDLGVASFSALGRTSADPRGTVAWMAPEQLRGGAVTPATDVYAAGLVLWEAFTGQPPRPEADGSLAALLAHRAAVPPAPSSLRPELPASVDAAILAALQPDPAARPTAAAWREMWAAAVAAVAPDAGALGRLVATAKEAAAEVRAQRTQAPVGGAAVTTGDAGDAGPTSTGPTSGERPPEAATRGFRTRAAWLPLAAVVAVPLLWLGLRSDGAEGEAERFAREADAAVGLAEGTGGPLADGTDRVAAGRPPDGGELGAEDARRAVDVDGNGTAAPEAGPEPASEPATAVPTSPRAVTGDPPSPGTDPRAGGDVSEGPAPPDTPADAQASATDDAHPGHADDAAPPPERRDIAPRPATTTRAKPVAEAAPVEVRPAGGPVHVDAGGHRGLAPQRSNELAPGAHAVLRLTGASPAFSVLVRAKRDDTSGAVSATIGAPVGELHRVQCGERPETPTPTLGVPVPPGGITCRFTAADGRTFSARLTDTAR